LHENKIAQIYPTTVLLILYVGSNKSAVVRTSEVEAA